MHLLKTFMYYNGGVGGGSWCDCARLVQALLSTWRSENTLQCEPSSLTSSETESSAPHSGVLQPSRPLNSRLFSCLYLSPHHGNAGVSVYGVHLYTNSGMWTQVLMLMWQVVYTLNICPSSQIHFMPFKYDFSKKGWRCGFVPSTWSSALRIVWVLLLKWKELFLNN